MCGFLKKVANNLSTIFLSGMVETLPWLQFKKVSHLNNLCVPLHKVHCICFATLGYESLLTLPLADRVDRGLAVAMFSDWVFWSSSKALHLDSSNVINSAMVGVSAREAVCNSHSRCASVFNVASIKSWRDTFKDNAWSAFMRLDTWLINWRNDETSPFLAWSI
jgi:hypothetical protein